MPFAREDLDSNLVSIGEELMVGGGREPQLQVWLTPIECVSNRPRGLPFQCVVKRSIRQIVQFAKVLLCSLPCVQLDISLEVNVNFSGFGSFREGHFPCEPPTS